MNPVPSFPEFKPLEIIDRNIIKKVLWQYQPQTSELTFANLFMWRTRYHYKWCFMNEWLIVIFDTDDKNLHAMEPIGPSPRIKPVLKLMKWLYDQNNGNCIIDRAGSGLFEELSDLNLFTVQPLRDHFDYLYSTMDLINLPGRRYHSKRNHLKRFLERYQIRYTPISDQIIPACLNLATKWFETHYYQKDVSASFELAAVNEALFHFHELNLTGAVLFINDQVEAFTFAEMLNTTTAVIHIEKASPQFHGIYTAINQMFCEKELKNCVFVNREQDLGDEGLRKSKLSYHPVKLIEKYRIGI